MTRQELIALCLQYPGAYEDYPFRATAGTLWTVLRHRGNKKAFAFVYEREGLCVNLKCPPEEADFLRRVHPGITPGYHMNKTHWNTLRPDQVEEPLLRELLTQSYTLTKPNTKAPAKS